MTRPLFVRTLLFLLAGLALLALFLFLVQSGQLSLEPVTHSTAVAVCAVQRLAGLSCEVQGSLITYPGLAVLITPLCAGLDQLLFAAVVLLSVFGLRQRRVLIEMGAVLGMILALNFARLLLFAPLARMIGPDDAALLYKMLYSGAWGLLVGALVIGYVWWRITRAAVAAPQPRKRLRRARRRSTARPRPSR